MHPRFDMDPDLKVFVDVHMGGLGVVISRFVACSWRIDTKGFDRCTINE